MRKTIYFFLIAALLAVGIRMLICYPSPQDITPRSAVALFLSDTTETRKEISLSIEKNSNSYSFKSEALTLVPNRKITGEFDFIWRTEKGTIAGYNKTYSVVVLLEPNISEGRVEGWNCIVYPEEAKPNICNAPIDKDYW